MSDKPSTIEGVPSSPERTVRMLIAPNSKARVNEIYYALQDAARVMSRSAARMKADGTRQTRRAYAATLSQLAADYKHFR